MPVFERTTLFKEVSRQALWDWHGSPGAFQRLVPPWQVVEHELLPWPLVTGAAAAFRFRLGPFWRRWIGQVVEVVPPERFTDRSTEGPFAAWTHVHLFAEEADGARLTDRVIWEPPLPVGRGWIDRQIRRLFARRHRITAEDLRQHGRHAHLPRMTVGITGATGLVGSEMAAFLRSGGHTVIPFVRREAKAGEISWDPATGRLESDDLLGLDAVINLAGEPIAQRWTPNALERIRSSRIDGTRLLSTAIARCARPPRVLVSGSAIGWYGAKIRTVDESSEAGDDELARIALAWEHAAEPAREAGVRVVHPRIGTVISGRGGALAAMLPLFRCGLGGPIGSGRQGMSWIALDDLIDIVHDMLFDDEREGAYNAVAPDPVDQATFAGALGALLRRPAFLPAPAPIIRSLLGEMGQELLIDGAFVHPARLLQCGHTWRRRSLLDALSTELGLDED